MRDPTVSHTNTYTQIPMQELWRGNHWGLQTSWMCMSECDWQMETGLRLSKKKWTLPMKLSLKKWNVSLQLLQKNINAKTFGWKWSGLLVNITIAHIPVTFWAETQTVSLLLRDILKKLIPIPYSRFPCGYTTRRCWKVCVQSHTCMLKAFRWSCKSLMSVILLLVRSQSFDKDIIKPILWNKRSGLSWTYNHFPLSLRFDHSMSPLCCFNDALGMDN